MFDYSFLVMFLTYILSTPAQEMSDNNMLSEWILNVFYYWLNLYYTIYDCKNCGCLFLFCAITYGKPVTDRLGCLWKFILVIYSMRCNIYISRFCYDVSVRLSVMKVHWRIIANLGFKFRSKFTVHCGHGEG